ncbi:hypothetical protein BJ170DRAFT_641413 [Xylariales sp. AK1849]|nr:hypothetical protein BJ170DRAFT_641413 [Xylariales sp. AK1849]
MVSLNEIRRSNEALKPTRSGLTAVVVGGTNGIGRGFLSALASQTPSLKVYIIGRSQSTLDTLISDLKALNPDGTYIPVMAGDLTLLSSVEEACIDILKQESKIDLLFMSLGYLSFGGRDESPEGLDRITSIRHYARTLFILRLLPLLNAAPSPRVVSALGGGLEGSISPFLPDDLGFRDPANYSLSTIAGATGTYVTLTLEQLQKQNPRVSFIHAFPGFVRSGLFESEHFGAVFKFIMKWFVMPTVGRLFFSSPAEAGERFLYVASSPTFGAQGQGDELVTGSNGEKGSGAYTLNDKQEAVHSDAVLKPLRADGSDNKIWEHTLGEIERVVGKRF